MGFTGTLGKAVREERRRCIAEVEHVRKLYADTKQRLQSRAGVSCNVSHSCGDLRPQDDAEESTMAQLLLDQGLQDQLSECMERADHLTKQYYRLQAVQHSGTGRNRRCRKLPRSRTSAAPTSGKTERSLVHAPSVVGLMRQEAAERLRYGFSMWSRFTHASLRASFEQLASQSQMLINGMQERGDLIAGLQQVKKQYEQRFSDYQQHCAATIQSQELEIEGLRQTLGQLQVTFNQEQKLHVPENFGISSSMHLKADSLKTGLSQYYDQLASSLEQGF